MPSDAVGANTRDIDGEGLSHQLTSAEVIICVFLFYYFGNVLVLNDHLCDVLPGSAQQSLQTSVPIIDIMTDSSYHNYGLLYADEAVNNKQIFMCRDVYVCNLSISIFRILTYSYLLFSTATVPYIITFHWM